MLPNLIIIGAMKCGTSSLHRYLNLHPQIHMASLKELDFFVSEKNWGKGLDWYEEQFLSSANSIKIYGESSPNYTKHHIFSGVPQRMHSMVPEAKLIYILRDPVKRILSHYYHQAVDSKETLALQECISNPKNNYVQTTLYYEQLQKFLEFYDSQNILVLSLESLNSDPQSVLKQVFEFLDVDSSFEHPNFGKRYHLASDKRKINKAGRMVAKLPAGLRLCNLLPQLFTEAIDYPSITPEISATINDYLADDLKQLRAFTENNFAEWSM